MSRLKKIKRAANALVSCAAPVEVFTISKIGKVSPDLENPQDARGHVAFVGTKTFGLSETGKMRPKLFLPPFHRRLTEHGVASFYYQTCGDLLASLEVHREHRLVVILVYGEDKDPAVIPATRLVRRIQERHPDCVVANHPDAANIIRDKLKTNHLLTSFGIPMPRAEVTGGKVFSNSRVGTKQPSYVTEVGKLDGRRYNTQFIDTRYEVNGVSYYCSLRALFVGGSLLDLWPRFRPVADGDPNVHSEDTPQDQYLLNTFYHEVATPLRPRVEEVCEKVRKAFGLGFYSADILYNHAEDRFFLCEVGYKFADHSWVKHCAHLSENVPWLQLHSSYKIADASADALVREAFQDAIPNL